MDDPSMSRRLPAGLLGMILLVAVVEGYLARHALDFGNAAALNWGSARDWARKARDCEILCLGSSLTTNGVLPRILEDRLGKRACNLAVFGGTMPTSYFLLKRALESGANPRVVVLDCQDNPVDFDQRWTFIDLWRYLPQWRDLLSVRECLDLAWTARDPSFFAAVVATKVLPSAYARYEIRKSIFRALEGREARVFIPHAGLLRNWRLHRGAQVLPARGQDVEPSDPLSRYYGRRERWVSNQISQAYSRRLLELLSRRGIAVFWTFPPLGPRMTAWREENGLDAFSTRYAEAAQSRFPGVTLVEARHSQYPARVFNDGLHLGRPGAIAYSQELASILARHFEAPSKLPRSLVLPPYRDPDVEVPFEHIYESGTAVADALVKRRKVTR